LHKTHFIEIPRSGKRRSVHQLTITIRHRRYHHQLVLVITKLGVYLAFWIYDCPLEFRAALTARFTVSATSICTAICRCSIQIQSSNKSLETST